MEQNNDINQLNLNNISVNGQQENDHVAILAVDIGTTNMKCSLLNSNLETIHSCYTKLTVQLPAHGHAEMLPEEIMKTLKDCIKQCIYNKPSNYDIKCMGISTQRNSLILWNGRTGQKYTNFILWYDERSQDTCQEINKLMSLTAIKAVSFLASSVMTNHRLKSFSTYKTDTAHMGPKLITQIKMLHEQLSEDEFKEVMCGGIESYVLWNLSKEKTYATDVSCACCTGYFDTFKNVWSSIMCNILGIPMKMLPTVHDSCHEFGHMDGSEYPNLDYDIPITSIIGDAQSSFVGESAFTPGDCVLTIGTGTFISVNVGSKPVSSITGAYPLAAYSYKNQKCYILHCSVSCAGIVLEWAKNIGLFDAFEDIDEILSKTQTSNGIYFVPAFSLFTIQDKTKLQSGFIGLRPTTTKADMVRAIIDSICFSIKLRLECLAKDLHNLGIKLKTIKIGGGVTRCNFLCQHIANLVQFPVEKSNASYVSSTMGAAFLAGVTADIWNDVTDLQQYRKVVRVFTPEADVNYNIELEHWKNAVERFSN